MFRVLAICCILLFQSFPAKSQAFVNGDLEFQHQLDTYPPPGWDHVPYNDPTCLANGPSHATSDICGMNGPGASGGWYGQPYSGTSFVGGWHSHTGIINIDWYFQEGIMQEVSGFTPGNYYVLGFYQASVRWSASYDTVGCWQVYLDNNLLSVSAPTGSSIPFDDPNLHWDKRELFFQASSTSHWFKFLPFDDDSYIEADSTGTHGVYMGIDSIYLKPHLCDESLNFDDTVYFCGMNSGELDAYLYNATYLWNDGSTNPQLNVTTSGEYWVEATVNNCPGGGSITYIDTINVVFAEYPELELGGHELEVCNDDEVVLDAYFPNSNYLWQDSSTNSSIIPDSSGLYHVQVDHLGCISSDTIYINYSFCNLMVPNVFTPNNDGLNDVFKLISDNNIDGFNIVIMNRWGNIVFESDDKNFTWDGTSQNGDELAEGTYFWVVKLRDIDRNKHLENGFVTLVK